MFNDVSSCIQADVLVNSLASDMKDLSESGVMSRAFLSAGGIELQQVSKYSCASHFSIIRVQCTFHHQRSYSCEYIHFNEL